MGRYILSVDDGGTYIKAGIYDLRGRQVCLEKQYNHLISPQIGYAEYDPDELWLINCRCMTGAIQKSGIDPREIICVGISAQGSGCYFIGENDEKIRNFITSADKRSRTVIEEWKKEGIDEQLYPYIYRNSSPGHTNAILAWLKKYEPENYRKIRWNVSMKDYIVYKLTGQIIAGYGCMSSTGLMNLQTKKFDKRLSELYNIPEVNGKFGRLAWDAEIVGKVSEKAALECGCLAGTLVAAGSHDVIATALAMGIYNSDYCFSIMGTCNINGFFSNTPILSKTIAFNELFAADGLYYIENPGDISSSLLEWTAKVLFDTESSSIQDIYKKANELVLSVHPAENDLVFIPTLSGSPENHDARGAWIGLTTCTNKAKMMEAFYESIVFTHIELLEKLFLNRERPSKVKLGGGVTNSDVWVQMFADALGIPVDVVPNEEMGAKGAAIVASIACGEYPDYKTAIDHMVGRMVTIYPRRDYTLCYQKKYQLYQRITQAVDPVWKEFLRKGGENETAGSNRFEVSG